MTPYSYADCMIDAFSEICLALEALQSNHAGIQGSLRDAALKTLPACNDVPAALDGALTARDPDLIRAVAVRFPEETRWTQLAYRAQGPRPGTLAHEMRMECLEALSDIGVALGDTLDTLVLEAHSQDRGDALAWYDRMMVGTGKTAWPRKHLRARLLGCGPGCAAHLRKYLDAAIDAHIGAVPKPSLRLVLLADGPHKAELKELAALLSSGRDITGLFRNDLHLLHPEIQSLVQASASSHGQLWLRSLEPDPVSLLGRPKTSKFFGMNGLSFQVDYPPP